MRLFVEVPLPSELTARAAALLPAALPATRPVRAELMHLTLAFLGWTPDGQLDAVVAAARAAATGQPAFELSFAGAGRFPPTGRPRVVCLGIGGGQGALATLARGATGELSTRQLKID